MVYRASPQGFRNNIIANTNYVPQKFGGSELAVDLMIFNVTGDIMQFNVTLQNMEFNT